MTLKPLVSDDSGRLASFTCPRCGYLPDRFLSRRISAQLKLNRLLIAMLGVLQLGMAYELWLANRTRQDITGRLLRYMDRATTERGEMAKTLEDIAKRCD